MNTYFKYGEHPHIESFVKKGQLRIGTLSDFRRAEHKAGVTDPFEGRREIVMGFDEKGEEFKAGSPTAEALNSFGMIDMKPGSSASFRDITFLKKMESPDCYVFCCSNRLGADVMACFEGNNAVAAIVDTKFFEVLVRAVQMRQRIPTLGWVIRDISYELRSQEWDRITPGPGIDPAVVKDPSFSGQCETRLLMIPQGQPSCDLKPFILEEMSLTRYVCRTRV